ncbi:MAG TPA: CARDB domain-containing protein [Acidimicrobiia bacterium]|nr:CARDB domain-containing protein [Acidimicrobiia bacterium]
MRARRTVRIGVASAVIAIGAVCAGCVSAPPGPTGPASLSVIPSPTVNFPNSSQASHFPMPQIQVTVTNTGGHTATNVVVHGVNEYSVPSSTCSTLAPGQSCTAMVQFCPGAQGQYTYPLIVTGRDASTNAPLSVSTIVTGTATA